MVLCGRLADCLRETPPMSTPLVRIRRRSWDLGGNVRARFRSALTAQFLKLLVYAPALWLVPLAAEAWEATPGPGDGREAP